jgi:hypothetical protein
MTRESADEDRAMDEVYERLTDRFPNKAPEQIREAIAEARDHFDRAPVRDFVPIMVEREARARIENPV